MHVMTIQGQSGAFEYSEMYGLRKLCEHRKFVVKVSQDHENCENHARAA